MKSRLALALLSGALLLGGTACSGSSSEATCAEWRNVYDRPSYSEYKKVIGQKCVRFGAEPSQSKTATTPATAITSGCIKTIPDATGSGHSVDYSACGD